MNELNFESYIEAIVYKCVKRAIDNLSPQLRQPLTEVDKLMSIEALINYLPEKPARQTVYGWVNARSIPFEKHGKRLYFRKSLIDIWLSNGRRVL